MNHAHKFPVAIRYAAVGARSEKMMTSQRAVKLSADINDDWNRFAPILPLTPRAHRALRLLDYQYAACVKPGDLMSEKKRVHQRTMPALRRDLLYPGGPPAAAVSAQQKKVDWPSTSMETPGLVTTAIFSKRRRFTTSMSPNTCRRVAANDCLVMMALTREINKAFNCIYWKMMSTVNRRHSSAEEIQQAPALASDIDILDAQDNGDYRKAVNAARECSENETACIRMLGRIITKRN